MRGAAIAGVALTAVVALSACGTATSTTSSTAGSMNADTLPAKEAAKAGRARSFVEPGHDNSIPTFGAESSARSRAQAGVTLHTYLTARATGAWRRACTGLAAPLRSQVEGLGGGRTCPVAYAALAGRQPGSVRADSLNRGLVSLRVKGRNGFALWVGAHGQKYVMPMARDRGRWRIGQIAPIPYPLGSVGPSP